MLTAAKRPSVVTVAGKFGFAPLMVLLLACSASPPGDADGDADSTGGGSSAADATTSTSSATSNGSGSGSQGSSSSSTEETGAASVCTGDYEDVVATTVIAPGPKMPGFGTYFEAACDVTSADAGTAELMCDGGVGEVIINVDGVPGLELAGLPEQVVVDMGESLALESSGAKHAISTPGGTLLFAYFGVANLGALDDPWFALLPMELDWTLRDCPSTSPADRTVCLPAALVIETASGTSEAPAGEVSTVAGGWQAFVSSMAECTSDFSDFDLVRFAIVSDTLL